MSRYDSRYNGDAEGDQGGSSPYDVFEDRTSHQKQKYHEPERDRMRTRERDQDRDTGRDRRHGDYQDRSGRDGRGRGRNDDNGRSRNHDYSRHDGYDRDRERHHRHRSRSPSVERSREKSRSRSKSKRTSGFDMAPPAANNLPGASGQHLAISYTCLGCNTLYRDDSVMIDILRTVSIFHYVMFLLVMVDIHFVYTIIIIETEDNCCVVVCCVWLFPCVLFIICVKKAMLCYMSHCATLGRYYCRFYVQRGTNARLAGSYSPSTGQLPEVPQAVPGMFQNMFPFGTAQMGALPIMPAQAMTQQATRHARRVYVGGLPPLANEQTIATFFSHIMTAIGGNSAGPGDAVVNVYINHEKKFAFVEMRTVEEASNAMALDGIIFEGVSVRVRRPTDYNPTLAAALGPSQPNPHLNLAAAGLTPGGLGGAEGPDRIFVGGLPYYFTEVQIRELLESFGPLRGFDLVKDRDTGNSKGYGFCVYEDQGATDVACAALNGLKMGDKTLTVRRATISNGQVKSEQESILAQAQQHIAIQKMALQVGGVNLPGVGTGPVEDAATPTKVLCLTEVITADELMDDGEYEEILEDMRDEGGKFGDLISVVIPRPSPSGEQIEGLGKVFLEYADTTGCSNARDALSGRKFGGNSVVAVYYPEDKFYDGEYGA